MIKAYHQLDLFEKKVFEKAIVEPPFRFVAEMPNEACFYYTVGGQTKSYGPTGSETTQTDEGVLIKCGFYLNDILVSSDYEYCEVIAVHLWPEVLKMIYDKEFPDFMVNVGKIKPVHIQKVQASEMIKNYIDSLQLYFENPSLASDELVKLKLKELILLLAKTDNAKAIQSLLSGLFSKNEINFKEVIEANVYNNLSLEELAYLTNLSLSSFKREFVKNYDCPPATYIRRRKLEKASRLLLGTELRVSDIAYDCGFNDLAHFSKTFQKEYGLSPSDYRLDRSDKSLN